MSFGNTVECSLPSRLSKKCNPAYNSGVVILREGKPFDRPLSTGLILSLP